VSLRERLKRDLKDKEFRHAYADEHLNLSISTQIKVIREMQNLSQAALAEKVGTQQAGISRVESANYEGWSIGFLRKLAEAFDLRLRVSFEEFGTLWREVDIFGREFLKRRKFQEDPEFKAPDKEAARRNVLRLLNTDTALEPRFDEDSTIAADYQGGGTLVVASQFEQGLLAVPPASGSINIPPQIEQKIATSGPNAPAALDTGKVAGKVIPITTSRGYKTHRNPRSERRSRHAGRFGKPAVQGR